MGVAKQGRGARITRRMAILVVAAVSFGSAPGAIAVGTLQDHAATGGRPQGQSLFEESRDGHLRPAASVEGDAKAAPSRSGDTAPTWSGDLKDMLSTAGFDDAVLLSGKQLKRLGDRLTAGWIAPGGELFGLLYVVPADEPGATMRAFVDRVSQDCPGEFDSGMGKLAALNDRSIGRAEATCRQAGEALHYDMIFYFTPGGTVGISHVGYDATQERARKINSGLIGIFQGL